MKILDVLLYLPKLGYISHLCKQSVPGHSRCLVARLSAYQINGCTQNDSTTVYSLASHGPTLPSLNVPMSTVIMELM